MAYGGGWYSHIYTRKSVCLSNERERRVLLRGHQITLMITHAIVHIKYDINCTRKHNYYNYNWAWTYRGNWCSRDNSVYMQRMKNIYIYIAR